MTDDTGALIATIWRFDPSTAIAEAISADGVRTLWVLTPGADQGAWHVPAHEDTGPLPARVRRRVAEHLETGSEANA
ncbi:hypothetical protein Xcel_2068 [Xylanimonas cellulosilytica DSM 15894]|uniref:Uncharacterized protein n=1 Tax=Xylanimonas cellulosilytica (strain DSM 15894 / JCM 12276 / CECT 5975 / KCTC 9989 / LMG 20990 / NBRC 107835 / XIL07) TaxID=446471 RepID=D1BU73_XYLCX|nr:hypothetical protein [Xylanimonas cellulosilytica]ACZ31086.1 hypothetical protein Xcel_2068 [Xylanimonas cellulosilytica DSM 15894]